MKVSERYYKGYRTKTGRNTKRWGPIAAPMRSGNWSRLTAGHEPCQEKQRQGKLRRHQDQYVEPFECLCSQTHYSLFRIFDPRRRHNLFEYDDRIELMGDDHDVNY